MSGKTDRIEHQGKVVDISREFVSVEIVSKSACEGCHARSVCAAGDEKIKVIEIPLDISTLSRDLKIGDTVNVILSSSLGVKALWYAYVIPMLLLLAAIFLFSTFGVAEMYVGLFSLGVVAAYYLILSFFRDKLSRVFTFSIE